MKSKLILTSIIAICISLSCKKKSSSSSAITPSVSFVEYRDPFIGTYKGIRITRNWNSNIGSPGDTTFNFVTNFVKSANNDSLIESSNLGGIHVYANGTGYPTSANAATQKNYKYSIKNDSLYYDTFTGNSGTGGLSIYFCGKKQ